MVVEKLGAVDQGPAEIERGGAFVRRGVEMRDGEALLLVRREAREDREVERADELPRGYACTEQRLYARSLLELPVHVG